VSTGQSSTIGMFLAKRLRAAGLECIFGVPGDYVLDFFDCLEESGLKVVCTCNELNAGYAADGYARINGVGAVCITYGVGGFSLFNAAVGAFAERVPLIIISGAPKLAERQHNHLLHHTIGDMNLQYHIYEKITVASTVLMNPLQAPQQIDATIAACLRLRRPVYIEIPSDIVSQSIHEIKPFAAETEIPSDEDTLDEALAETVSLLEAGEKCAILAGVEIQRLKVRNELRRLIDLSGYPYATTLLGKAVVPEQHPHFVGVYNGAIGSADVRDIIEEADVLLSLGTLMTDINLGLGTALLQTSKMIVANSDNVRIKHHIYKKISLKSFINGLCRKKLTRKLALKRAPPPPKSLERNWIPIVNHKITADRFYQRINLFIDKNSIIISDTGDSLFGTSDFFLPEGVDYIGQAFYLSIGYSIPAALGVKMAVPRRRPIIFVGDGAFQMTVQEISTMIRHKLNLVIFLLNNDGYTTYVEISFFSGSIQWRLGL